MEKFSGGGKSRHARKQDEDTKQVKFYTGKILWLGSGLRAKDMEATAKKLTLTKKLKE